MPRIRSTGTDVLVEVWRLQPQSGDRLSQPVMRVQLGRGMVRVCCRAHGVSDFSYCSLQRLNTLNELRDHDSC